MTAPSQREPAGRSCPRCQHRTDRVARGWLDRLLNLFMPVARHRCASARCGWEGLLMRRHGLQRRASRTVDSYHPQRLDAARLRPTDKPPRA